MIELDENGKPIEQGYLVDLIDTLAKHSKHSKTELRRRLKAGAIRMAEDGERVKITHQHLFTKLPITVWFGKREVVTIEGA